jgi:hypothetical protein
MNYCSRFKLRASVASEFLQYSTRVVNLSVRLTEIITISSRWTPSLKLITFGGEISITLSRKFPKHQKTISLVSKTVFNETKLIFRKIRVRGGMTPPWGVHGGGGVLASRSLVKTILLLSVLPLVINSCYKF